MIKPGASFLLTTEEHRCVQPEVSVLREVPVLKKVKINPEEHKGSTLRAVCFREVSMSFRLALSVHLRSRCPALQRIKD